MLRSVVLALTAIVFAASVLVCLSTGFHVWPPMIWSGLLLLALLFERWRYQSKSEHPEDEWVDTDEVFQDPETGRKLRVQYHPASGERRYVNCKSAP